MGFARSFTPADRVDLEDSFSKEVSAALPSRYHFRVDLENKPAQTGVILVTFGVSVRLVAFT